MKVKLIKDFEIRPGKVLKKSDTPLEMFSDDAKRAIDAGKAIDVSGKYTGKKRKVKEK